MPKKYLVILISLQKELENTKIKRKMARKGQIMSM